ncbi:MAG TPA: hypothetical protein ENK32_00070 [Anaerolineae bacterium]|nr:hypothetical protein [Anaerolineae bacterium]
MAQTAVEVREALAPVVASTDVVLIPVAPGNGRFADFAPERGWRRGMVRAFDRMLRWGQRRADTPEAMRAKRAASTKNPATRRRQRQPYSLHHQRGQNKWGQRPFLYYWL